jgi:hypothetical protein
VSRGFTTASRESAIQAAVSAAALAVKNGQSEAHSLRWKGSQLVLPVASVDVDLVLLSPHSHRIKAQLQSLPEEDQAIVRSDPYGAKAQNLLARLLRETAGYERIKNALAKDGQLEPGVVTTGGVLVNANTRVVALRELRHKYVKAVVLPKDAGPKEITELELRLQMEEQLKQPYSFTSQLLFIEDLITSNNYTTVEVGQRLRPSLTNSKADRKKAESHVEGELRLLGLIREVLTASGGALTFLDFDDRQQALIEIDQDYQKLKNTNPSEAQRIRDAQLAGMIAGVDCRRLREIDGALLNNYVGWRWRVPDAGQALGCTAPAVTRCRASFAGLAGLFEGGEDDHMTGGPRPGQVLPASIPCWRRRSPTKTSRLRSWVAAPLRCTVKRSQLSCSGRLRRLLTTRSAIYVKWTT